MNGISNPISKISWAWSFAFLFASTLSFGAVPNPKTFFDHFAILKDEHGQVDAITFKQKSHAVSLQSLVAEIKGDLSISQSQLQITGVSPYSAIWQEASQNSLPENMQGIEVKAFEALGKVDVDQVFSNPHFKNAIALFENKLTKANAFNVLAKPNDPGFFYQRALVHGIADQVLNFSLRGLDNLPVVNIVTFVIEQATLMIDQRREFSQNMILHYLDSFDPAQLSLTPEAAAKIRSSIYESRISFYAFWESRFARSHWGEYGQLYHTIAGISADAVLEKNKSKYEKIGDRLDYAFNTVSEKGKRKVVNLLDRKFLLSNEPSDAYFFDAPKKLQTQRRVMRLVQMGLRFVPIPGFLKSGAATFIQSTYASQVRTEGALFGFLDSIADKTATEVLLDQSINPFLRQDMESGFSVQSLELQ